VLSSSPSEPLGVNRAARFLRGATARGRWVIAAAGLAVALAAFSPVLDNGFVEVFDDAEYITANGYVRQGLTLEGARWALAPAPDAPTYWHPLTWLSLMADVQLFGVRPEPIHAENVLLHLTAALLLFAALARMTGARWRSAAVALVFAIHPLQVEAVAWAVERKAVLSGALGMGALLAYARWVESGRRASYAASLALFSASLLAKPQLLPLPFLLVLLDVWPLGRTSLAAPAKAGVGWRPVPLRTLALEKVGFVGAALAVVSIAVFSRADARSVAVPIAERLANALTGTWWYLEKIAWPAGLAPYYPVPLHTPAWHAAAAAAGLVATIAVLWSARRQLSLGPLVGCLWFLAALVPFSGVVRIGLWPGTADRFAYTPMIGAVLAVVWIAAPLVPRLRLGKSVPVALLAAAVLVLATRTHAQVQLWRDTVTLFGHAARVNPPHRVTLSNLGAGLKAAGRVDEARSVFEALSRALPEVPDGPLNLGVLLHERSEFEGAELEYAAALSRDPGCAQAHFNLGLLRKRRGDRAGALESFGRAVASGFRSARAFDQLGDVYAALGRDAESERSYRAALRLDPLYWRAEARLGVMHAGAGRHADAARAFESARRNAMVIGDDPRVVDEVARSAGVALRPASTGP